MANLTPTAVSKSSNFVTGPSGDKTNDVLSDLLANRTEIYSNLTSIADEFYGATPPANPNVGRKWRCSTTAGLYVANTTYRWNGSAWAIDIAETVSVPYRNCVLEGPVNSAGATILFSVGTGLTVDLKATVRLSFANGFTDDGGASDYFESITSDDAAFWSSLPINSTVYLYFDRESNGTVTGGYSTLAPVYQSYAPTHSAGLNWFDTNTQKMFVSNGSTWTQVWRVFVGTATTNASSVTAVNVVDEPVDRYLIATIAAQQAAEAARDEAEGYINHQINHIVQPSANQKMYAQKISDLELKIFVPNGRKEELLIYYLNNKETGWDTGKTGTIIDIDNIRVENQLYFKNYGFNTGITENGTWTTSGSYRLTSTTNNSWELDVLEPLKFNFDYYALSDTGIVHVFHNGNKIGEVDTYSASAQGKTSPFFYCQTGKIRLVCSGTKNDSSGGTRILLNAIKVIRNIPLEGSATFGSSTVNKQIKAVGNAYTCAFKLLVPGVVGDVFLGFTHGYITRTGYTLKVDGVPVSSYSDGSIIECNAVDLVQNISVDYGGTHLADIFHNIKIRGNSFRTDGKITFVVQGNLRESYFTMLSINTDGADECVIDGVGVYDIGVSMADNTNLPTNKSNAVTFIDYASGAECNVSNTCIADANYDSGIIASKNSMYVAKYHYLKTKAYFSSFGADKVVSAGESLRFGANYYINIW